MPLLRLDRNDQHFCLLLLIHKVYETVRGQPTSQCINYKRKENISHNSVYSDCQLLESIWMETYSLHACMYTRTYTHTHTHTHIHTYTHTHIHTYTHSHIHWFKNSNSFLICFASFSTDRDGVHNTYFLVNTCTLEHIMWIWLLMCMMHLIAWYWVKSKSESI